MKIKKTIPILFLMLLVFIFSASAYTNYTCTTTYLDESFEYSDNYVNHGWDLHSTCTYSGTRQAYPFSWNISGTIYNESFGINATIDCGSGVDFAHRLDNAFSAVTSGEVLFAYNITLWNRTGGHASNSAFTMSLYKAGTANKFQISHGLGQNNYDTYIGTGGGSAWGVEACTSTHNLSYATEYEVLISLDLDTQTYTLYIDKAEVGCSGKSLGVADEFSQINVYQYYRDAETSFRETDDIIVCSGYLDSLPTDDTVVVDDLESGIRRFYQDAGLQDEESQHIAGILILLAVVGGIIYMYYVEGHNSGTGGLMGAIFIGFILSILLTVIDLLPLWIPVLWFILGGVGVFFCIKSSMSGGG